MILRIQFFILAIVIGLALAAQAELEAVSRETRVLPLNGIACSSDPLNRSVVSIRANQPRVLPATCLSSGMGTGQFFLTALQGEIEDDCGEVTGHSVNRDNDLLPLSNSLCLDLLEKVHKNFHCHTSVSLVLEKSATGVSVVGFTEIYQGGRHCTPGMWEYQRLTMSRDLKTASDASDIPDDKIEGIFCSANGEPLMDRSFYFVKSPLADNAAKMIAVTPQICIQRARVLLQKATTPPPATDAPTS